MSREYEVGYRKPPKDGQFAKGHSGNPRGRPKGSRNMTTLFRQISHELIHITENGKTKTVTRIEAVLRQMTSRAMSGDPKVMREFIQHYSACEAAECADDVATAPNERETVVMQSVLKRMKRMAEGREADTRKSAKNSTKEKNEI